MADSNSPLLIAEVTTASARGALELFRRIQRHCRLVAPCRVEHSRVRIEPAGNEGPDALRQEEPVGEVETDVEGIECTTSYASRPAVEEARLSMVCEHAGHA